MIPPQADSQVGKQFPGVAGTLVSILLMSAVLSVSSCRTIASRYLGFRLSPDRVQTRGELEIVVPTRLEGSVTVYLDRYSVPHIRSDNEHDLYFALGYMQARDRRFQLEMLKLLGYGRLREMVGGLGPAEDLAKLDLRSRMLGFYQDARAMYATAPNAERAVLGAFAEGINAATLLEPSPMEFRVLGYAPEQWRPEDSLVIVVFDAFSLCKDWEMELARLELACYQLQTGDSIERALEIYKPWYEEPPYLADATTTAETATEAERMSGTGEAGGGLRGLYAVAPELAEYLQTFAERYPRNEAPWEGRAKAGADFDAYSNDDDRSPDPALSRFLSGGGASNNWAVDGRWTGTGKGALASDPHMPHMLPPLGYLFHLEYAPAVDGAHSEGYRVIGGSFLGIPGIVFGTNGEVAWGVTSNWADVTDLYVEQAVPGRPGFYRHGAEELPFHHRSESFRIRKRNGGFTTETRTVRETIHGVVVNDFDETIPQPFPLVALCRNRSYGTPIYAALQLYRAKTVKSACDAVAGMYVFTGHWALADAQGDIAYAGSARLPRRTKHLGTFPSPGWSGEYDWASFVPSSALPRITDPPRGFLATANQEVYPPFDLAFPVNLEGSVSFRYRRIMERLAGGRGATDPVEIFSAIQRDGLFLGWQEVRALYLEALGPLRDDLDPTTREAAELLLGWNGKCGVGGDVCELTAPTIFNTLNACLLKRAMADEVPPEALPFYLTYFNIEAFLYGLLRDPTNPAWDCRWTDARETFGEELRAGFREAVSLLRKEFGELPAGWTWNRAAPFVLKHPFGDARGVARFVNRGPLGTGGMTGTVFHSQSDRSSPPHFPIKHGPVLRIAVDLADLAGSCMCLPGGESGRPTSEHFDDMLELYRSGRGVSMEMAFPAIARRAAGRIVFVNGS